MWFLFLTLKVSLEPLGSKILLQNFLSDFGNQEKNN